MMANQSEFLDTHQTAKLLGVKSSYLRNARLKTGPAHGYHGPPSVKHPVSGRVVYRDYVVDAFLKARLIGGKE